MLKRTLSGACYVALLVAFFLLREFVDYRIFHILTYFFAVMGTFEVARAVKPFAMKGVFVCAIVYSALFVPLYLVGEYLVKSSFGLFFAFIFAILWLIVISIISIFKNIDNKSYFYSLLPFFYPTVFLLAMLSANDLGANAFIALLMAFVISPCSDTFAYLVGSLLKGPKLCPKLSPKKTWSGAIGGVIGGIVGSILVYFIFKPTVNFFSPVLLFVLVGLVGSILTMIGDLFESFIKRRVGIKDMGKIMPGHGGVMDRIDGTLFLTVLCAIVFALV